MKFYLPILSLLFCSALASVASAQDVRINELMAANATIYPDNHDFDDYSDWIELENLTSSAIDLTDYFLTDDPTIPLRWRFPTGTSIPANGFLVIRADGFDAGPGETHRRDAAPWAYFTTINLHTNFKLSASGESVVLNKLDVPSTSVTYLESDAVWKYFDQGSLPAADWFAVDYADDAWQSGPAEIGYGDGDEATEVSYGSNSNDKYITTYFRTSFNVTDPTTVTSLDCIAKIDDGAVIYLNGNEVARLRMDDGTVLFGDRANSLGPEGEFEDVSLLVSSLVAGNNVLAVEVHQRSASSSDISLVMEISGVESTGSVELVDSVDFDLQIDDVSYGRDPSTGDWVYFGEPTPNAGNSTFQTLDRYASSDTEASHAGGFYPSALNVVLSSQNPATTIRYTLDGSIPSASSAEYTTPVAITESSVLRARTFEDGKLPGALATYTYIIDEASQTLPTVSLTVEPDTFFDSEIGIYDNVFKGREAFTTLEYIPTDGSEGFKVGAGVKIGGENIWRFAQKPLNIALRGKYGDDLINYQFFPDENIGTYDSIGFRNGGDNWEKAMLRDPLSPSIAKGQLDNDVSWYRPVALYLNGTYWGIHNARLRMGDSYFFNRYGIQSGNYDLLVKAHGPPSGSTQLMASDGDTVTYTAFEDFIVDNDMSVTANYEAAVAQMNLDSLMDYCASADFVYESSWQHNQEFWRERADGAKWRWNINDIDRGFNSSNINSSLIDNLQGSHPIFGALCDNTDFTNRFVQRYAAHLNSTFHPDRIADIVDTLAAEVEAEIARHIARWEPEGGFTAAERLAELAEIKQFAIDRGPIVYADMAGHMNIANQTSDLDITISPAVGGRVFVNDVPILPEYTTTVKLFDDIAFDLTAEAAPGYVFTGWSSGSSDETISQTLTGDASITANFALSSESVIPAVVSTATTLTTAGSPYVATGDIDVDSGVVLTVEPGVTIRMPEGASFYVRGALDINGTAAEPVTIEPIRSGTQKWGALCFVSASGTSTLSHLKLTDATLSGSDPVNLKAAVSASNSSIVLEYVDISAPFPVFARGGSTTVRFSQINPTTTGDGINVKGGAGLVEDCTFFGNDEPDTDAIDFDGVTDGVIRRNRIYGFNGFNSDGIDIGEGCVNLQLSENRIFHSSDKGISVGQGSEVYVFRNLIVGCDLGVAVKDTSSTAYIDQNTFVGNRIAVSSFEKNFNKGGGIVYVSNSIFSRSKELNTEVDSLSILDVDYSLSDTLELPTGSGNITGDPLFTDTGSYDFSIAVDSPAIDSGDPAHALDSDDSRADMGAYYIYDPEDYPFYVPNVVVINELLSHSNGIKGDFIELHNTSSNPIDIGGWFLSDSASDLEKYEIATGTIIPAYGYLAFHEVETFGVGSSDPGSNTGFAYSENGETAYLYAPNDGQLLSYYEEEAFGAASPDYSFGRYFKTSTNTYNFVTMDAQTPDAINSDPKVGPIIISEIMYHPLTGDAEYFELMNVSSSPVTLYDTETGFGWQISSGVTYSFPTTIPVMLEAGERCLLVGDYATFSNTFSIPEGTQVFEWTSGGLSNGGERLEISSPGDVNSEGVRQFIREDRITYEDEAPWAAEADLGQLSLTRVDIYSYGNDPSNWSAVDPSPGHHGFGNWANRYSLPIDKAEETDDADGDGRSNFFEYALGTNPSLPDATPFFGLLGTGEELRFSSQIASDRPELLFQLQSSPDLSPESWEPASSTISPSDDGMQFISTTDGVGEEAMFYRLTILKTIE